MYQGLALSCQLFVIHNRQLKQAIPIPTKFTHKLKRWLVVKASNGKVLR